MDLSAAEIRVLGSLVEKQLTTPQQYPLTLNALTLACSQSSNRDPVVAYDERTTEAAVTSVKTRGWRGSSTRRTDARHFATATPSTRRWDSTPAPWRCWRC